MPIRNSMPPPPPPPPDPLVFRSDDGSIGSGLGGIKGMQHCGEIGGRLGNLQRDWGGKNFTISAGRENPLKICELRRVSHSYKSIAESETEWGESSCTLSSATRDDSSSAGRAARQFVEESLSLSSSRRLSAPNSKRFVSAERGGGVASHVAAITWRAGREAVPRRRRRRR